MSEPSLLGTFAATAFAAWLMIQAGLGKRRLEWRSPRRRCPSCRHARTDCTCRRV